MATWTRNPIGLDAPSTSRAKGIILDGLKEGFLFQGLLILLLGGPLGAQDQVDDDAGQE